MTILEHSAYNMESQALAIESPIPLEAFLSSNPDIKFIRIQWQDFSGILRTRICAAKHLLQITKSNKPLGIGSIALQFAADSSFAPGFNQKGLNWFHPCWSSLRRIAQPENQRLSYASVMCEISESFTPGDPESFKLCPRRALVNTIKRAKDVHGLDVLVGFELEFMIVKMTEENRFNLFGSSSGCYTVAGLRHPAYELVEECVAALIDHGVEVQAVHTEGREGQYEISLGPRSPVEAVEEMLFAQDMIKTIVSKHGYHATMAPKPFFDSQANGLHTHFSIQPTDKADTFLAGILKRLPMICAFTLPYARSYLRVKKFEAGETVSWGTEIRKCPIRKIEDGHWEARCVDATANMYLALSVLISSGIMGMEKRENLWWEDAALTGLELHPACKPLPKCLNEALNLVEEYREELETCMDSKVISHYVPLKKYEMGKLEAMEPNSLNRLFVEQF